MNTAYDRMSPPVAALLQLAAEMPGHVALVGGDETWTYQRLAERSLQVASGLAAQGVGPGDRVALHLWNTPEAVLAYLACLRLGAVTVPLNTRLAPPELQDLAERTRPSAYIGHHDLHAHFAPVPQAVLPDGRRFLAGQETTGGALARWSDLMAEANGQVDAEPAPDAPAVLLSTSGTTGRSKIVIWSHQTLGALTLSAAGRDVRRGDTLPLMSPLMHGSGLYYLVTTLAQRATGILIRRFDAPAVLDAMEHHKATSVFGLPFMCAELAREQRANPRAIALTSATAGGDTCPEAVEKDFEQVFGVPLRSFWAATEDVGATFPDVAAGPYMRLIAEARAEIAGADGEPVVSGEVGELVISSPTTTPGYWVSAAEYTPLPGGRFRSGDLVREVKPGLLEYVGRHKDLIIRGGSNISPIEVEGVLRAHPNVADAAVAGYPDEKLGQRVGALLVLEDREPPAEPDARFIRAWASQRIAEYKLPERMRLVNSIPRNALTKIDRAAVSTALEAAEPQQERRRS
jgi:long-chain acyl-CoA synthetase